MRPEQTAPRLGRNGHVPQDFSGYTLRMMEPNIVRVHVMLGDAGRGAWQVPLNSFLAG